MFGGRFEGTYRASLAMSDPAGCPLHNFYGWELVRRSSWPRGMSRTTELLWGFEFGFILAGWVSVDRRVRGFNVPYEFDAFVFFIWPFVVPYYLYRTRGGRGLLFAACIYIFYLTPHVVAVIARIVR